MTIYNTQYRVSWTHESGEQLFEVKPNLKIALEFAAMLNENHGADSKDGDIAGYIYDISVAPNNEFDD